MPFDDAGNNEKRWKCFCCGKDNTDYESYASHIKENHEQGREWIECPACEAPVRDMKVHFKAKHPQRTMPSGLQTRVVVWKDIKPFNKDNKGKTRKVLARQGTFISIKCGKELNYKSGMEEEFFNLLEQDVDVQLFLYENIKVPYFFKGAWHNYIPDLKIFYVDGSIEIWEVKPTNQLEYEQNKAKWAAANNFCANLGWRFIVQTEEIIPTYRRKIQEQINAANVTKT